MPATGDATPLVPAPGDFRWEAARGTAGFVRVAPDTTGRWWLTDAADRAFFGKAVHGVRPAEGAADPAAQLRQWGFNAVGAEGAAPVFGLPYFASVNFCGLGGLIHAPGARLPDVFAPDWPRRAAAHALEVCTPLAADRSLIGWLADDALAWGQPGASAPAETSPVVAAPTLLQICLSLEPNFAAYHAAWEFVLALHGGKLAGVARTWGIELANKEVVREHTRAEQGLVSRAYLRDNVRWTREFARRYFASTGEAIRAADPNHLVLGPRRAGAAGESVRVECVYPAVDLPLVDWNDLPATAASGAATGPVLADDVCWADEAFLRVSAGAVRPGSPLADLARALRRVTTVERMLKRGRAGLERAARHPAVAGYVWRQWLDEPGEQPPFARGLLHLNGAEAREHTELLAEFNARAEIVRCAVRPGLILSTPLA
jgi:agarase